MLRFLKKIFQKEEVEVIIPKETIAFAEIGIWFEKNSSHNAKSIWESAEPILEKIEDTIFAARANLNKLEHAELRNKNIGGRELEIMKGNRSSYIKRTEQFFSTLASLYDKEDREKMTYKVLKHFVQKYQEELKVYHTVTLKPYAVLQHFFANESYTVAKNIKELDEEMKKLDMLLQKQSTECQEEIHELIDELKKKRQEEENLKKQKAEQEEELQRLRDLQQGAEDKKTKAEQSDNYHKYLKAKEHLGEQERKCKEHVIQLQHSFSVIEKALRKYAKENPEQEQVVQEYCEDPAAALEKDAELKITSILDMLRQKLEKDELDIKDDKKEKTMLELVNLTKSFFETWLKEYKKMQETNKAREAILHVDVALQEYKEAEYMVAAYKEKAEHMNKQVQEKEEQIIRLKILDAKSELEKEMSVALRREIEIQM
ncbi:hypothetical protein HZA99_03720 [Candidatus Woesearchaeota archaeon]|nr:hypothetical protein [Candidatus Woesearchaeota archaeon]